LIVELEVLSYAAGGNCVAKYDGRVIFIRGVIPGERVRVSISESAKPKRFAIGELVEVLTPAPKRVEPACKHYGECGGCDWQHIDLAEQKEMQFKVISDQLSRIGKFDDLQILPVISVDGDTGLGYRTRARFATTAAGALAMRKSKSHELVEISDCLIVDPDINNVTKSDWPANSEVTIVKGAEELIVLTDLEVVPNITYRNSHGSWQVPAGDFWQVHKGAPKLLIDQVLAQLNLQPGDRVADLYSGVGLFALPIARQVGSTGSVVSVENDLRANQVAQFNLADFEWVEIVQSDVAKYLKRATGFTKAVVDPPRSGLNESVIESLSKMTELNQVCYVSCDPGTLARDLRSFADRGWKVGSVQPMLLFPMTAHLETIVSVSKLS
jgi:tRNA/tmRNA/rRNA uracil-C5-methylase (TrmA/RlmC/RlmD family)